MTDIVNEYFQRFYPTDMAGLVFESDHTGRECVSVRARSPIFPAIVCRDGFSMSVQGHSGAYSSPRSDFAKHYHRVEVWCLSSPEPMFDDYGDGESPFAYVPTELVCKVIEKHGGIA